MRQMIRVVALLAMLGAASCEGGMVRAAAIQPTFEAIRKRHDAYVAADKALSAEDKETYLRSTRLLQETIDEALKEE